MRVNGPPPYLAYGVQLARTGRRAEALPYLRYAAYHEMMVADAWLWLASVTDDLEEYRLCVGEALAQRPDHAIARRMQRDLDAISAPPSGRQSSRRGDLRRLLAVFVLLIALGGITAALVLTGEADRLRSRIEDALGADGESGATLEMGTHRVSVTVGQQARFSFEVVTPDSWLAANTSDAEWRAAAESLVARFPATAWDSLGTAFDAVRRDPVFGTIAPAPRLVETDPDILTRDGLVSALSLQEIVPYPDLSALGPPADSCEGMHRVEAQYRAQGKLSSLPGNEVITSAVQTRAGPADCVFTVERRQSGLIPSQVAFPLSDAQAPTAQNRILIAVGAGPERYALWALTVPENPPAESAAAITRLIETLVFVPD